MPTPSPEGGGKRRVFIKMAELPKDEPSACSAFCFADYEMKTKMTLMIQTTIFAALMLLLSSPSSFGAEINSRYITLIYKDEKQLIEFDRKALRNIPYHKGSEGLNLTDEVAAKLDMLVEKVMRILVQTPPRQTRFTVELLPSETDIRKIYSVRYGKGDDYIAFYSPTENTIFISIDDARLGVLVHEIAHAIISKLFYNAPTKMIHEALAQFVEDHIDE